MLGIVPKLYEDELFYSWLCRYYVAKGFTSNSHFIEEVTGNNRLYLNKEFVPPFKAEFRHDIEKIFGFENVIRNHTLYGQEARFYTEEEINNVWELLQTDSFDIRTLFRMQKSKEGHSFSYCPLCVKEERESIGECYWHKSHQIQGIDICLKHRCKLKESEIRVGSKHNDMISPAEWWCNDSEIEMLENTHCLKYYNYVWKIANAPCHGMDAKKIIALLYKKLKEKGYRTLGQRLLGIMSEDMEQYYEEMGVSYEMCYSTLQTIFAKYNYPFIAIIQTAYFLGVTAEELLNPVVSDFDIADEECSHYVSDRNNTNINRDLMDRNYLKSVKRECELIYSGHYHAKGRPMKVSALKVCKRVGITHTLIKFMPLCKACIDEYAETDDEYHARIIVWAYRKLKAEKTDGEIIRVSEIHKLTSEWKENIIRALPYMAKFADQEMINEIDALAREKHWHRNLVD